MPLGNTAGHANTPFGTKVYYKPSLGKVVFRKPGEDFRGFVEGFYAHHRIEPQIHGMLRRSMRVLAINDRVAANPPAARCAGRPWKSFVSCLRREMKATVGGGAM